MKQDTRSLELNARRHTLLIDADDTLWENNIYFEQAIAQFLMLLDHTPHTAAEVREHLNRTERKTIALHGYGLRSFQASLTQCLEDLLATPLTESHHLALENFVRHIADHTIEVLDGVADTLAELAGRCRLVLVTKGDQAEQLAKLEASGLATYFVEVKVLREKDRDAYCELIETLQLDPKRTTMVGNSPKSDINPALAAGLHAALIAHSSTWVLEHEPLDTAPAGQRLLELDAFPDLLRHF